MLKTKTLKILIVLGITLLAVLGFNINTVNATSLTEEEIQARLDLIPDELTLDIKEIEYEKSIEEIEKQLTKIWQDNNMDMSDVKVEYYGVPLFSFYTTTVRVEENYKHITLTYSNTNQKNAEDEAYIKNLKIESPKYFEVDFNEYNKTSDKYSYYLKTAEKYYTNLINDDTITAKTDSGAGDLHPLGGGADMFLALFKDGKLYDVRREGNNKIITPVIKYPNTMADENIKEYITNYLKDYLADNFNDLYALEDIKEGINKENIHSDVDNLPGSYTVKIGTINTYNGEFYEFYGVVVAKRSDPITITTENIETNIKLEAKEGVVPSNVVLEVIPVTEGTTYYTVERVLTDMKQFKIFDINLLSDGVKVQPNGKVKITIPVPTEFDKSRLVVYRIEEDGTKTEYEVTATGETVTFETDHFSTYVLAEKTSIEKEGNTTTPEKEKDETPATGNLEGIYYVLPITIISALGIITFRKKENK